jgi:TetR/AcrR family transcriptional regulator, lmrAB and yxaGH operons repressor
VHLGSLYHHLPGGKDDLVLHALDAAGGRAATVLDGLSGQPADVVAERFISLWRAVLTRSGFTAGCSLLAVTVATDSEPLLDKAGTIFAAWTVRSAMADSTGNPA